MPSSRNSTVASEHDRQSGEPTALGSTWAGFHAFFDTSPHVVALLDAAGTVVAVNRGWRRFAEANEADPNRVGVGMNYLAVCEGALGDCAEKAQAIADGIRAVLAGSAEAFDLEYACHSPTENRWFHATVARLAWTGPPHVVVTHVDVTGYLRDQSLQLESEAHNRAILQNVIDAIVTINADGTIVMVNAAATRMFGYDADELIGRNVTMLMPPSEAVRHSEHLMQYRQRGTPRILGIGREVTARRRDGHEFPVWLTVTEAALPDRTMFVGLLRDLTEQKAAEKSRQRQARALALSNAELEQFAYVASHDLQEPLRMVTSYLQLLEHRYGDKLDKDAHEFIQFSIDGAARMRQLINDMLTVSRVTTSGKSFEAADTEAALSAAKANLRLVIDETHTTVTHDPLPLVRADPTQMVQLFQNLLSNAMKFRREDPAKIHVSYRREAERHRFGVTDNGIGIDARYFERIFMMFQRLHSRADYPGTGVGLAVCRKIVERHGGRIWVESEPGRGSTFWFTIPAEGGDAQ